MVLFSSGITPVSVRRARKRCRRRTATTPQPARKVRCLGCKLCRTKTSITRNTLMQGYCSSCWMSWLERRASRQHLSCTGIDGQRPPCVECGAEAKVEGTNKFQGLGYCIACALAYLTKQEELTQAQSTSSCNECGFHPATHQGKHEFAELSYCATCWDKFIDSIAPAQHSENGEWVDVALDSAKPDTWEQAVPMCAECNVQHGVFYGRYEFQKLLYCGECWLSWMESPPDEKSIEHADLEDGMEIVIDTSSMQDFPVRLCADCNLRPGHREGTKDFVGSFYCEECHDKWFERSVLEVQGGPCVQCHARPGEISGFNGFEGSAYCLECWMEWQDEHERQLYAAREDTQQLHHVSVCEECKKKPGEVRGSREFSIYLYCRDCFLEFRKQVANSEDSAREQNQSSQQSLESLGICDSCKAAVGIHRGTQDFHGKVYCKVCWDAYRDETGLNEYYGSRGPPTMSPSGHFDFIEVGTSTWGTLSQYCSGDYENGSPFGAKINSGLFNLFYARGLAIEPVSNHLAMLPSLPNVTKVHAAMDESSGEKPLFYVSPANVSRYMGQLYAANPSGDHQSHKVDVMWYAMSLSRIGQPHSELEQMLKSVGRLDLLESQPICVLNWEDLCVRYNVNSVDVVQMDCEGEDCAILRGMLAYCEHRPQSFPRVIQFEANHLTDKNEIEAILVAFKQRGGYQVRSRNDYNIILQRSSA